MYDVIIVGGRPSGASLAARLGQRGRRVLVLERADLATAPAVPSCPTLHMGTLALLDELGVPEAAYAPDAVLFRRFVVEFGDWFAAVMPFPTMHGRSHGLSIDRARFDPVLWEHLAAFPTVERRTFTVEGLLREGGVVVGVVGHAPESPTEELRGRWVVGADGRFSSVARWAGAEVVEEEAAKVSTVYFTDWVGLAPWRGDAEPSVMVHATGRGLNVLTFPLPDRTTIWTHIRADRVETQGDAAAWYERTLRSIPKVAERLEGARQVGKLLGVKRVGNGYRTAGGPGWVLAGDAWHYKDPVDGQGIYDALLGTRILAEQLDAALSGKDAATAVADYAARARAATHPMFLATVGRLANELYSEPPVPVIHTLLRWMLQDRVYQERFIRFLGRDLDPARWLPGSVMPGIVARGIWRDVRGMFGG